MFRSVVSRLSTSPVIFKTQAIRLTQPSYLQFSSTKHIINEAIRAQTLRVVSKDPETHKSSSQILSRVQALALAKAQGLDLVLIQTDADPPVCKLEKISQVMLQAKEKEKKARLATKSMKEMLIKAGIDPHDLQTKMRKVRQFLEDGHPVKLSLFVFRKAMYKTQQHIERFAASSSNLPIMNIDDLTTKVLGSISDLPVTIAQKDQFSEKENVNTATGAIDHENPIQIHFKRDFILSPRVSEMKAVAAAAVAASSTATKGTKTEKIL